MPLSASFSRAAERAAPAPATRNAPCTLEEGRDALDGRVRSGDLSDGKSWLMLSHRERSRTTVARSPARRSAGGAKALPLAGRRQIFVRAPPPQPIGCLPGERDVGKNILIFSDGTGQRGGLQFAE